MFRHNRFKVKYEPLHWFLLVFTGDNLKGQSVTTSIRMGCKHQCVTEADIDEAVRQCGHMTNTTALINVSYLGRMSIQQMRNSPARM